MKLLVLLSLCSLLSIGSYAQEPKGTVSGKVTDERDQPLRDADVFIYKGDEIIGSATTEGDGAYLTNRIYAGTYRLQVIYGSYAPKWVNDVTIKEWEDTKVNIKLEVAKEPEPTVGAERDYSGGEVLQSTK